MFKKLQKYFFPLILVLLTFFIAWKNYVPGTILSGWDTLHPEFNLPLYLKRAFFGAWQEHQGLGVAASQAHAAEIPRLLIIYLLSLILPLSMVRYAFFFLCLGLGTLGIYYFARYLLRRKSASFADWASFLASLFYVFNLTTVQHFYVPLEMFAIHFASLPWLFFLVISFLREGKRKYLFWFGLVSLFAAGMAHTATLFYVYLGALAIFVAVLLFLIRKRVALKRGAIVILLTLTLNSFWLLPNIYYIAKHSEEVSQSKIHRIFSDEAFLQGKAFGDIENLALSKNFLFNWREFNTEENTFVDLMDEWETHLNKPRVVTVGYVLFAFAVLGILASLLGKSNYALSLLPILAVSVFFWINSNPPFTDIFNYLRDNFSLLKEALRFPFTKFSILLTFVLATYFAFSVQFILKILKKLRLSFVFFLIVIGALVYFALPIFSGYLISPSMKVNIPGEYFEVFDWFKEKDKTARIAKFPVQTHWGWNFYNWGYQGAGFTWFGLPQSTLDREFDRWSAYNESFYSEIAFAVYSQDLSDLEKILKKYQVRYLLLDESVLNAGGSEELLFLPEIKELFNESDNVVQAAKFGFLTVYETSFDLGDNFVNSPKTFTKVNANLTYLQIDPIYSKYGTYIQDEKGIVYPFVNFDKRGEVQIQVEGGKIVFINKNKDAKVTLPIEESIVESFGPERGFKEANNCDLKKIGRVTKENLENKNFYGAYDGGVSCDFFNYPNLSYSQGYVLRVRGENKLGRSLKIYLYNKVTRKMDLEELLPGGRFDEYFVILPRETEGEGYTLNIETRSYGKVAAENILEAVEFYPVSIDWLTGLYSKAETDIYSRNRLEILAVDKLGTSHYLVKTKGDGLMVLGQGYEEGWQAFLINDNQWLMIKKFFPWFFGKELEHLKVNSWANGWMVPDSTADVAIVYWPQYLEYFGFGLVLVALALTKRRL